MAQSHPTDVLSVVNPICCGLDVHKDAVTACILSLDSSGKETREVVEFGTMFDEIVSLDAWLAERNCPIIAMESTSTYWMPIYNVMEGHRQFVLVNARYVKNLPGRKTDISDSMWLAGLLRVGLLRPSFLPCREVRNTRELWMLRNSYVASRSDFKRRVHKYLQSANIKIDSVVTNLFGATGLNLLQLLVSKGSNITLEEVESCARGSLTQKVTELHRSIQGFFSEHHRAILADLLDSIRAADEKVQKITDDIRLLLVPYSDILLRLDAMPGINEIGGMGILSMIGTDLSSFRHAGRFCSWTGVCPGNNQSAGKRRSGKSPVKKHPFKTLMVELALAAVKTKGTYYKDKFFRLRARRGGKRALIAIAHKMCEAIFHIIKNGQEYRELGEDYLSKRNQAAQYKRLTTQAQKLGFRLVPDLVALASRN